MSDPQPPRRIQKPQPRPGWFDDTSADPQPPTPLDAFFARCEDVLTDWQGSGDAMHSRSEEPWRDTVQVQGGTALLGTHAEVDAALLSLLTSLRWSDLSYRDESHIERGRE